MIETVKVDIMMGDTFFHTIKYSHDADYPIDMGRVAVYIESKLPTLKNKSYEIYVQENSKRYEPKNHK